MGVETLHTTKADVWASEFMRLHPDFKGDEGDLIGWFANAIGRGYDAATHKYLSPLRPTLWSIQRAMSWRFTPSESQASSFVTVAVMNIDRLLSEGWDLVDFPGRGWAEQDVWLTFIVILGSDNFNTLAFSERQTPDGPSIFHGQFIVSPTGRKRNERWGDVQMKILNDLNTAEHVATRRDRNPKVTVFLEDASKGWSEHDADSTDHAKKLIREHVNEKGGRSGSAWLLQSDYTLKRAVFILFSD